MKKTVFLGLLVILLAFGFIGCDNGNGTTTYTVSIGTLTNGSISANPIRGVEGTEITLTIVPDSGYRLKSNTLRFGTTAINEETLKFNLPAENVIVTAEFELIQISNEPKKIIITGLTGKSGEAVVGLFDSFYDEGPIASGRGTIFNDSVTIELLTGDIFGVTGDEWTGHGEFRIILGAGTEEYMFTNGYTFEELEIFTDGDFDNAPRFNIVVTISEIDFAKFQLGDFDSDGQPMP
ncbi:MAG: hypothetical protein FWC97_03190 [Treponema sp.]|nr:hypothetical protein [Treponema sp.]